MQQTNADSKRIYYTMVLPSGMEEGRYSTSIKGKPRDAAKKAANQHFKSNNGAITLTIRRLGTSKTFTYEARREQLRAPMVRTRPDGSTYTIKYKINISRISTRRA
jgi:hypothetical protein